MKKIALLLAGISYCEEYRHASCPDNIIKIMIDYRKSMENYKEYIFKYFKDYEVDIFICSNPSILSKQLIDDYKPKKFCFIGDNDIQHSNMRRKGWVNNPRNKLDHGIIDNITDLPANPIGNISTFEYFHEIDNNNPLFQTKLIWGPASRLQRNTKIQKVIELCMEHGNTYDNVIVTRFDLLFKKDFDTCPIDLSKINIVTQMEDSHSLCDNFYILPFNQIEQFYNVISKNILGSHHTIRDDIEKINKINFICNENTGSSNSSFYSINRLPLT